MLTVIYGITANTRAYLEHRKHDGQYIFATTNGGEKFEDHYVHSLSELEKMDIDQISQIVICSQYLSEIVKSLKENGFSSEKIFFFDHSSQKLNPIKMLYTDYVDETSILYAIYDLRDYLPTYDFINFCVLAEVERKIQQKKHLSLIIVPNRSSDPSADLISPFHSDEEYEWRISKILLGVASCLPSIKGYQVLNNAEEISKIDFDNNLVFPINTRTTPHKNLVSTNSFYKFPTGTNFSVFQAPKQAKKLAQDFINSHCNSTRVITVTLREYAMHSDRNSDIEQWTKFLLSLDLDVYFPVIIRDTATCSRPLPKCLQQFEIYPIASIDFPSRVALYEKAWLNIAVSNGPTFIFNYLPNCHSITFMTVNDSNPAISTDTFKKAGVNPGEHYPFRDNSLQHLVWKPATFKNIINAFNTIVKSKLQSGK